MLSCGHVIEIIDDTAGLQEFHPEWSAFAASVSPRTPFQRPDWLACWWSHPGSGALRVLVFREGQEIIGVLPMFLLKWQERRQLTLLGSGISDTWIRCSGGTGYRKSRTASARA